MILNWLWKIVSSHKNRWRKYLGNRVFYEKWLPVKFSVFFHYLCQGGYVISSVFLPVVSSCDISKTRWQISVTFGGKSSPWAKEWFVFGVDPSADFKGFYISAAFFNIFAIFLSTTTLALEKEKKNWHVSFSHHCLDTCSNVEHMNILNIFLLLK